VTRLFIELYLDEDVDILVAQLIRARGFTVRTTAEAGQLRASDAMQLTFAADQRMTLLTHNRVDFEVLQNAYAASGQQHGGIIVAARRSPYELTRRLLLILDRVTADEMEGQLRYI
jgi:acetolactate synthase regulatory subunit